MSHAGKVKQAAWVAREKNLALVWCGDTSDLYFFVTTADVTEVLTSN